MLGSAFGGKNQPLLPAPADIEVTLECTLHEFYNGCLKKLSYERQQLMHDGKTTRPKQEEINVEVKPGFSEATVIQYTSKGNEAEGHYQSKLVIHFSQAPHSQYRRKGDDLIYTHTLSLEEALLSQPVKVKALDGRNLIVTIDEIITPQTVKLVEGEGMPTSTDPSTDALNQLKNFDRVPRGNLYIRFDIQLPSKLSNENKQALIAILRKNAEEHNL